VSPRAWKVSLLALVALRLAVPLVVLAAAGSDLPALPPYEYEPLNGDATGFYAEARELISATFGPSGAAAFVIASVGAWMTWRWRERWEGVAVAAAAVSLAASVLVLATAPAGAAVVGWPLVWAVPLLPLRVVGALDVDAAFVVGLALSLVANAATVVVTAYSGLWATGRRGIGIAAAALVAAWPLLVRGVAGPSAWENGQWNVDVGLHLYTEPLSTAVVSAGIVLVLAPSSSPRLLAGAGALLGFATVVKVSNAIVAAVALAFVLRRAGVRASVPFVASGAAFLPLVAVYWPKGYPGIPNVPGFSLAQAGRSWSESSIFEPQVLLVLLPLAVLGLLALSPACAFLFAGIVASTASFYTFYEHTHLHPRFLYVTLPWLFVLIAAGGALVFRKLQRKSPLPRL